MDRARQVLAIGQLHGFTLLSRKEVASVIGEDLVQDFIGLADGQDASWQAAGSCKARHAATLLDALCRP